jgi:hypothetical protein
LNYDRTTPSGTFVLKERLVRNLPSKPNVYVINLFSLTNMSNAEEKVKHLQEEANVNPVAEVNLN